MNNINKRRIYNTILSQTISTDGRYLFAGNNFGEIFVYRFVLILIFKMFKTIEIYSNYTV